MMHRLDQIMSPDVRRCDCGFVGSRDELHDHIHGHAPLSLAELVAECEAGWREVMRSWAQWSEQRGRWAA